MTKKKKDPTQIELLANYIMKNFPEYIIDGGAADVAITIMDEYKAVRE